jgi:hypothetical protein
MKMRCYGVFGNPQAYRRSATDDTYARRSDPGGQESAKTTQRNWAYARRTLIPQVSFLIQFIHLQ